MEVKHLPPWEVDWTDASPQRDTATVTISDILPSERDGLVLESRAVDFIMRFLVTEFRSLNHLQSLLPHKEDQDTCRSNVVPMKLLFLDEKYKAETTEIITRDAELTGKPEVGLNCEYKHHVCIVTLGEQIIIGDQLTCKVIMGWRESDITSVDRLQWALEVPGILCSCMKV